MKKLFLFLSLFILISCSKDMKEFNEVAKKAVNAASGRDRDKDGIPDSQDACPTQKETLNGYQDSDGCPDTPPPPPPPPPVDSLPLTFMIPNVPPVESQAYQGACVAFAIGYYIHSIYTGFRMSPAYLYNNTKVGACASGSAIITSFNWLKNKGGVTWEALPYDSKAGCDSITLPNTYKIPNYGMVLARDTTQIKKILSQGRAIAVNVPAMHDFYFAGPGFIWETLVYPAYGPHTMAIVGYDSEAFIVVNSYGTSWGDAGYTRIRKSFLDDLAYDLYYITN